MEVGRAGFVGTGALQPVSWFAIGLEWWLRVQASDLDRLALCCLLSRLSSLRAWPQSARGDILGGPARPEWGRGDRASPCSPAKGPLVLTAVFEGTVLNQKHSYPCVSRASESRKPPV